MSKYRIIKHKNSLFYIQKRKYFLCFSWWHTHGSLSYGGAIGYETIDNAREMVRYWHEDVYIVAENIEL